MASELPHIEDVAFSAGYRVRTALSLIRDVTGCQRSDSDVTDMDLLCSAEALLMEANDIIRSAVPDSTDPLAQVAE